VGIFWDFDESDIKVDTSVFAAQVFEIAKSYSSSRYINDARLYTKSSLDELIEHKLGDIGFEVSVFTTLLIYYITPNYADCPG
jgi:hypothetical protein